MAEATIGIDLGTTNSVVASTDEGGEPRVLPDEHDEKIHPSVVSFHPNGTVIVGAVAKQRRIIDPNNTVFSVKRLIGRTFDSKEVQAALTRMPFRITEGPNEQPIIHTRGGQFAIPEISAIVLDHMRAIAKRARRETAKAVITVPANFNEGQRNATATAGAIAGLEVIRVLNEPTAAAIAYGHRRKLDQLIAVYDFGGGTFDVSILSVKDQLFEVVATAGNTFLGGDDIDETLVEHMVELFLRQENVDLRSDDLAMQRLRSVAEQIKIQLSRRSRAIVKIDEIAYGPGGRGLDLKLEITREELVARCAHVVDQTFPVCDEALKLASIDRDAITDVVLVGGTTKMPYVRQRATQYFGKQPRVDVNPDEAVALGAAVQANVIAMEIAGELSYRRAGSADFKAEVTRVDPNLNKRVASMLRESQVRRAQSASKSVIVEQGGDDDTDLEFADDYTDGTGIFVSVDTTDDEEVTRAASEPTYAESEDTRKRRGTSGMSGEETDRGWDADDAWGADDAWETYPATTDAETGTDLGQRTTKPETLRGISTANDSMTDTVPVAQHLPGPRDETGPAEAETITRAAPKAPLIPPTKPLPVPVPPQPAKPSVPRTTNKMPPPVPKTSVPLPLPPRQPPLEAKPLQLMPEAQPLELMRESVPSAAPSAPTLFEPPPSPPRSPPPPLPAAPSARTLYEPPPGAQPFTAPPAAPAGLGLDSRSPAGAPTGAPTELRHDRPAVSPYGLPELGSQPLGGGPVIRDVTSYTLGIGTVSGFCESLINRNTSIPHQVSRSFATSKDGQTTVRIKVFQGESRRLQENTQLGELVLENLPPGPRGQTAIDVTFKLNASGLLDVHAIDTATGYQQQATLEIRGMATNEEVAASQNRMQELFQ